MNHDDAPLHSVDASHCAMKMSVLLGEKLPENRSSFLASRLLFDQP
jgi:hypothetical protein